MYDIVILRFLMSIRGRKYDPDVKRLINRPKGLLTHLIAVQTMAERMFWVLKTFAMLTLKLTCLLL